MSAAAHVEEQKRAHLLPHPLLAPVVAVLSLTPMHTCPCHSDILTEAREEQKYRKGSKGVSALGLASGKKISQEAELEVKKTTKHLPHVHPNRSTATYCTLHTRVPVCAAPRSRSRGRWRWEV